MMMLATVQFNHGISHEKANYYYKGRSFMLWQKDCINV